MNNHAFSVAQVVIFSWPTFRIGRHSTPDDYIYNHSGALTYQTFFGFREIKNDLCSMMDKNGEILVFD